MCKVKFYFVFFDDNHKNVFGYFKFVNFNISCFGTACFCFVVIISFCSNSSSNSSIFFIE